MKRVVGPGPGAVTGEDRIPRGAGGTGHIRQGGQSQGLAWEAPEVRPQGPRVACKPSWPLREGTGPDLLCPPPPGPSGNPGSQGEFWGVGGNPPTHCRQPEQFQKALLMGKVRHPCLVSDQPCVFPRPEHPECPGADAPTPTLGSPLFPLLPLPGAPVLCFCLLTTHLSFLCASQFLAPFPHAPTCTSVSQQPAAQT